MPESRQEMVASGMERRWFQRHGRSGLHRTSGWLVRARAGVMDDLPVSAWAAGWVLVVLTKMENLGLLLSSLWAC